MAQEVAGSIPVAHPNKIVLTTVAVLLNLCVAAPHAPAAQTASPAEPPRLVIDAAIEYTGTPASAPVLAELVNRLREFWSVSPNAFDEKGEVLAAADFDSFGAIRDPALLQPATAPALNLASLNALGRLKSLPLAFAQYPPNRRRLTVTFYYNAASIPGPVPPPAGWPPDGAFRIGDGVVAPRLITTRQPNYTRLAMQARIQGVVRLEAVVRKDGTIGDAIVVRSLDRTFGLDQQALNAVKLWTFAAGSRSGEAVDVLVSFEMTFTLR